MKPGIVNAATGVRIEFDTEAELLAYIATISPPDLPQQARRLEMYREDVLCARVLGDLRDEFKKQVQEGNLTVAQATTLFTVVRDTFLALKCGWLREARGIANNTATTAIFTAPRKTFLLSVLDAALTDLNA